MYISLFPTILTFSSYGVLTFVACRDVSNNDLCGTIPTTGPFEHFPLNKYHLVLNVSSLFIILYL